MRKRNIGIITFHWGTNYGGILQSYALQKYLQESFRTEVKIINYAPKTFRDSFFKVFLTKNTSAISSNCKEYFKDRILEGFRKRYLSRTIRYYSDSDLKNNPPEFDIYISGSDQVWNHSIIDKHGSPYYLNFGNEEISRISYAASFGSIEYPEEKLPLLQEKLNIFNGISVRENGGIQILKKINIRDAKLLPDPVLLLDEDSFIFPVTQKVRQSTEPDYIFIYALQSNQKSMSNHINWIQEETGLETINTKDSKYFFSSIEEWLHYHRYSKFVLTNSFHGVLFSLIFKKKFLVFPIEGLLAGMNDRLFTLLDTFDLKDRLVEGSSKKELISKLNSDINWEKVKEKNSLLRSEAHQYLSQYINSEK